MSQRNEIRTYDYVNYPYASVRDMLRANADRVFSTATTAAASRAQAVTAELFVSIAGVQVGVEISTTVGLIEESGSDPRSPVTRIPLQWRAAQRPRLFPTMSGVLSIYALTATETQLDFLGQYEPPLSVVGDALDAIVGHRIAEASVRRFIEDIARYLRAQLS